MLLFNPIQSFIARSSPAGLVVCVGCFLWLALVARSSAQDFLAAADERNLWLILSSDQPGLVRIFHHLDADPPGTLEPLTDLRAQPLPLGVAAAADQLWLVDRSRLVFLGRLSESATARRSWSTQVMPALPAGTRLLFLTADPDGPWALVRVESPSALEKIDALPRFMSSASLPASSADSPPLASLSVSSSNSASITSQPALPTERLLRLHRFRWHSLDLPADWPSPRTVFLAPAGPAGAAPWLLCTAAAADHAPDPDASDQLELLLWRPLHRHADSALWSPAYRLPQTRPPAAAISLQGQLLLAYALSSPDLQLDLHLVRPRSADPSSSSTLEIVPLGQLRLKGLPPHQPWALLSWANTAALLARSSSATSPSWLCSRIDLRGRVLADSEELRPSETSWFWRSTEYLVLFAVVLATLLILLVSWQRDPASQRLDLPAHLRLADLSVRALAALIDLLPCTLLVVFLFGLHPREMLQRWPGSSASGLQTLLPGALVIVFYITHCALSELFTARTLGKAIFGLRVTDLQGRPPYLWQVLVRNLLKSLDLIAWLLLILPLLSPNRQRLGDLIARTVVVAHVSPTSSHPPESS